MRIDLLRRIDYFIGIPACFLLSVFETLNKAIFNKKNGEQPPKKIIILEFSEMGSIILACSAIEKIKQLYPGTTLYFWTFQDKSEVFDLLNIIPKNNLIFMRNKNIFTICIDAVRNLHRIRKEKIDTAIDLELFARFSAILAYLSGAKNRVGFYRFSSEGLYRGNLHSHKVSYSPYLHISRNFLSLVYSLKAGIKDAPLLKECLANDPVVIPEVKLNLKAKEDILKKLKIINPGITGKNKIVILNPGIGESLPIRAWPGRYYMGIAKKILTNKDIFIVVIGKEAGFSEETEILKRFSGGRILNLTGKTNLEELIALLSISIMLISHDSGTCHLASLTGIYMIVLFGPENPMLYAPLNSNLKILYSNLACSPCITAHNHRHSVCRDNKCLKMISVEEVYAVAKNILDRP